MAIAIVSASAQYIVEICNHVAGDNNCSQAPQSCTIYNSGECDQFQSYRGKATCINNNTAYTVEVFQGECVSLLSKSTYNNSQCINPPLQNFKIKGECRQGTKPSGTPSPIATLTSSPSPTLSASPSVSPTSTSTPSVTISSEPSETETETTSAQPSSNADCFSSDATVQLESGVTIPLPALKLGDKVRVNENEFSEVFFLGHWDHTSISTNFVEIRLEDDNKLVVSRGHMIYVNNKLVQAKHAKVGDTMVTVEAKHSKNVMIMEIKDGVRVRGLYNPHTMHGDLVVNGIRVSTFTNAMQQQVAHAMLLMERVVWKWKGLSMMSAMFGTDRPSWASWVIRNVPMLASS